MDGSMLLTMGRTLINADDAVKNLFLYKHLSNDGLYDNPMEDYAIPICLQDRYGINMPLEALPFFLQ